jgi:hypothetical protein
MCQAGDFPKGERSSAPASPPQSSDSEDAVHDSSGCVWCDVGVKVISVNNGQVGHETKDGIIYFCSNPQRQNEERSNA